MKKVFLIILIALLIAIIIPLTIFAYRGYLSGVPPSNKLPTVDYREGATAKCNNGKFSYSTHRSGTCSGNGGIARWLDGYEPR